MALDFIKDNISSLINLGWALFVRKHKIIVNNYNRNDTKNNNFSEIILPDLQRNKNEKENDFSICFSSTSQKTKSGLKTFIKYLKKYDILYIVGNAGYGKSTLTKYIYKQLFRQKLFNVCPFYVQIKKLDKRDFLNNTSDLIATPILKYVYDNDIADREVNIFGFHKKYSVLDWQTFIRQFSAHKIIYLFIDGYDETAFIDGGFKVIDEELKEIIRNSNRKVKLIISSRYEPNLLAESKVSTLYVSELKENQKQEYIKSENIKNNQQLSSVLNSPLLLTMYAATNELFNNHNADYITDIQTQADIYWNYYCYYLERFNTELNNLEYKDSAIIFFKYILPFIAYNLEFENQVSFTKPIINEYWESFKSNYECFKKTFHFNVDYECVTDFIKGKRFDKFIADIDLIEFDGVEYWFNHLTQRDFYAALFEYFKDYCILQTNYNEADEIRYNPYEGLDEKVTIHNYTRVLYSNIVARRIINHMPVDYPNPAKYYCIKSDLHYYGDSKLIQKNIQIALDESIAGYNCCKKAINVDELSKNWLAWNIGFIVFNELKDLPKEKYSKTQVENAKLAIEVLKEAQKNNGFGPAYDKFAKIYTTVTKEGITLYDIFKDYNLLSEEDLVNTSQTKTDKAKELLKKAVEKKYHFACNNLGYLYEQEGNICNAYKYFSMSVENDQLDLYARARCAVYLLYNSKDIHQYSHDVNELLAYHKAFEYLNDGYKYYYNNKGPKPYDIMGIYNLVKNLAEFGLLCHQKGYLELLNFNLGDSYEYYQSLFSLYILEYDDKNLPRTSLFESKTIMEDLLCYCLVCLIIKKEGIKKDINFSALNTDFKELCKIVNDYFNGQNYEEHKIFHFERFNDYYDLFCKKYNEVTE